MTLNFVTIKIFSFFTVDVGYSYEGCDEVFWHTQAATMSGYDITSSEIGGWNLHIHHTYNFQEGKKLYPKSLLWVN